ncbi:hypothetical protein I7I48_06609 [Histoplasma ohiense]|nr:hypothetical protein I7I48_06609 [Histoplasma ohiense (nom. inval.)]
MQLMSYYHIAPGQCFHKVGKIVSEKMMKSLPTKSMRSWHQSPARATCTAVAGKVHQLAPRARSTWSIKTPSR